MLPYILLFHKDQLLLQGRNSLESIEPGNGLINDFYQTLLLIKNEVNLSNNEMIFINARYRDLDSLNGIINYFKNNNIKKCYFFIEDVMQLEKEKLYELEIINLLIQNCNFDYEVYHCERTISRYLELNVKYFDLFVSSLPVHLIHNVYPTIDYNIEYTLSCFNFRADVYRQMISALLYDRPNVLVTLLNTIPFNHINSNLQFSLEQFNEDIKSQMIKGLLDIENNNLKLTYDLNLESYEFVLEDNTQWKNMDAIKNSFVKLVTETKFYSPCPNFSEKTIKPISVFRPFILMAPPKTLQLLKDLGFKTFDNWWDESYDDIIDHHIRFEKIYELVLSIINKPKEELETILHEMSDILIYNRNHLMQLRTIMLNFLSVRNIQET